MGRITNWCEVGAGGGGGGGGRNQEMETAPLLQVLVAKS